MPTQPRNGGEDWDHFYDALRDIMHGIRGYMDLYEREVLFFIYERTAYYNKEWEIIPLRHFLEGVYKEDQEIVTFPVAMTKRKLLESLKHLEAKRIIEVRRNGREPSKYKINHVSTLADGNLHAYLRREQPTVLRSLEAHLRTQVDKMTRIRSSSLVRQSTNARCAQAPTVGAPEHQCNIHNSNIPNSNIGLGKPNDGLRKITLRKRV